MSDSILDDVRAAAAGQGGDAGGADTGDVAADIVADVAQAAEAVETPEAEGAPADDSTETAAQAAQRARDEAGRFAKAKKTDAAKTPPKPTPAPAAKTPPAAPPPAQQPPAAEVRPAASALKAPQAWTPAAREAFAKAPPEVQAEVDRREREMARFAQQSAPHRQLGEGLQRVLEPYRALLTDEPLKVVGNLLQTAAQLQTAPPAHRAQLVARIVREYGVDIHELDSALAGETSQPGQGQPKGGQGAQSVDPRSIAQQVRQELLQEAQQRRAQSAQQQGAKVVEDFIASAPEFLEDVRDDMADLIEARARRGIELKPADAYTLALQMHPEISQVLQQREAAKAANAHTASTQSKRDAASSVRSKPAGVVVPKSGASVLDDVEAAAAALSGR